MGRVNPTIVLVAIVGSSGCQYAERSDAPANDAFAKTTFRVIGMMKAKSGAT